MERRRFLELALTVSVSTAVTAGGLLTLTGCGGGRGTFSSAGDGDGESVSTRAVAATLSLPGGFPIALADLRVETALGGGSVGADGAFSVLVSTTETAPVLAMARSGDNALFVGFVTDGATLTIRSTAVALLYFALGGYTVPTSNKTEILGMIEAHPTVGPLTEVLTARLVVNPLALSAATPDVQIAAALETAMDTLLAERPETRSAHPPAAHRAARATITTRAEENALLLTSPTGLQSDVELLQGSAPQTITLTNHARRYCQVYLYETGNKQKGGAATTYDRAKIVTTARLSSTPALSIGGTIFGIYSGHTAGVPVSLEPIALSMASGAEKTNFEVVVLGSSSLLFDPAIYSDPHYAAEVEGWRDTRALLNVISWLIDVAFSLFLEFWGLRDVSEP